MCKRGVRLTDFYLLNSLALTKPNVLRKIPLEINFLYLGNKEIYRLLNTQCVIYILFPTKYRRFHDFNFFRFD